MPNKVMPFLWFSKNAAAAAKFYCKLVPNSKVLSENELSVTFSLGGLKIIALNGGTHYELTPAFSLYVECKTQKEIDYYWSRLSKGGKNLRCGWLTDKFGVTWQIIPSNLTALIGDRDREKAGRAFAAMMKMKKLDIAKLEKAHGGRSR